MLFSHPANALFITLINSQKCQIVQFSKAHYNKIYYSKYPIPQNFHYLKTGVDYLRERSGPFKSNGTGFTTLC